MATQHTERVCSIGGIYGPINFPTPPAVHFLAVFWSIPPLCPQSICPHFSVEFSGVLPHSARSPFSRIFWSVPHCARCPFSRVFLSVPFSGLSTLRPPLILGAPSYRLAAAGPPVPRSSPACARCLSAALPPRPPQSSAASSQPGSTTKTDLKNLWSRRCPTDTGLNVPGSLEFGDTRCTPGKYPAGVKQLMHFTSRHQKLVFPDAETAKKSAEAKRELPFERTR